MDYVHLALIKRRFIHTRQLKPGMKIDQSVVDRLGRNLIARGAVLDEYVIDSLLKLGIMNVYIQEGEMDPEEEKIVISPAAQKNIEKLHTDDRSKVTLSNSVRERVAHGIQYIYSNAEAENLADATDSITNDLLGAIDSNDAIAIDINALKTSDEYTFKHSVDVATIAMILAKA